LEAEAVVHPFFPFRLEEVAGEAEAVVRVWWSFIAVPSSVL
jgi:hypothetical protein